MKTVRVRVALLFVVLVALASCGREEYRESAPKQEEAAAQAEKVSAVRQAYPKLSSNVVFENDRVVAQRVQGEPGVWSGEHAHPGGQLVVVLEGATLTYREGGEEESRTFASGELFSIEPTASHDHAVTSDSAIDFVLISMAAHEGGTGAAQKYPNQAADVVLENDQVIVQRVMAEPGKSSGEHSHSGSQLAVVLEGAPLAYREGGEEKVVAYESGNVYWVDKTAAHDHVVKGDKAWDGYVITLK
ncbi:MAG: cupin domain-containing protein [Acidobacteriota bacterium]|nr:cupin domain-containing protein [Acidobacteriota bacterium]